MRERVVRRRPGRVVKPVEKSFLLTKTHAETPLPGFPTRFNRRKYIGTLITACAVSFLINNLDLVIASVRPRRTAAAFFNLFSCVPDPGFRRTRRSPSASLWRNNNINKKNT